MPPRLATAALIAIFAAGAANAQAAATLLSGNASANVKPMVGAGLYQKSHEFGYYLNGAVSMADTNPYYDTIYPGEFGDTITDRFGMGYFLNIGASLPVGKSVRFYGGVGVAGVSGVVEQNDPTHILSPDGTYYVPDQGADAIGANYNAGVLVSAGKVVFEAGYNTYFDTGYLGIGFGF